MLWPYPPRVPTLEKLLFLTNVMETPQQEKRVSVRLPRVSYIHSYLFDERTDSDAYSRFRSNPLGVFKVPVWSEYTEFEDPQPAGVLTLPADTNADYQSGDLVFVNAGGGLGQLREIGGVSPEGLSLVEATSLASIGCSPVRECYCVGGLSGGRLFKGLTERSISFVTVGQRDISATPFSTFSGAEVVTDPTLTVSPLVDTVFQSASYIDNGSGLVSIEPVKDILEGRVELSFMDVSSSARWARKRWLSHLRGREKSFWVPSWTRDYILRASIPPSAVSMEVEALPGLPSDHIGRSIMVSGTSNFYRTITSAFAVSGGWRFLFSGSFGESIPAAARVSRLRRFRLDTDEIEISYLGRVMSTVSLICKEVPS